MKKIFTSVFSLITILALILPSLTFAADEFSITTQEKMEALTEELRTIQYLVRPETLPKLSQAEIKEVISNAVSFLQNSQEESGHFAYEYLPYEGFYRNDDNIVRQAGTLFDLGEVLRRDPKTVYSLEKNIISAIEYFEGLSYPGEYGGLKFRCIVDFEGSDTCKLGATSLALIGMLSLAESNPKYEKKYDDLIEDYVNYILAMKKEGAGFRNNFFTDDNTSVEKESSFFNGEALLALVRYQNFNSGNKKVSKTIEEIVAYIDSPDVAFDVPLYLWVMAALKDLNEKNPSPQYFKYAKDYTDWRMEPFVERRGTMHNMCAYLEGIVSAYSILDDSMTPNELKIYRNEIDFWLAKSALLQIDEDRLIKFNPKVVELFTKVPNPGQALGGFLTGHNELTQRIDFTQHCLSSYLQAYVDIDKQSL